jgi:hypothetical protein
VERRGAGEDITGERDEGWIREAKMEREAKRGSKRERNSRGGPRTLHSVPSSAHPAQPNHSPGWPT